MAKSPAQEMLELETNELLGAIVGPENVSPELLDVYWRCKFALDRQGGGGFTPQQLAIICVMGNAVILPEDLPSEPEFNPDEPLDDAVSEEEPESARGRTRKKKPETVEA